jgi:hypothetical protein
MGQAKGFSRSGALTAEDFEPDIATDERRKEPRFPTRKIVMILPCAIQNEWKFRPAQLFDCSTHGLGFITGQMIAKGEQFLVKLKLRRTTLAVFTVRHCRPINSRRYIIGAEISGIVGAPEEEANEIVRTLRQSQQNH